MKISFLADPITNFIKDHDSSWALMRAAHRLGHKVFYAHSASLSIESSQAAASFIELDEEFFDYQIKHESKLIKFPVLPIDETNNLLKYPCQKTLIDDFDLVFMRKDPPVDSSYLHQCQILSLCKKAKIINNPDSLIKFNEKLCIFNFPELISPTIVTNDKNEIKDFLNQHHKIVLKPIDGKGGEGIFVIEKNDLNFNSIIETLSQKQESINPYGNSLIIQKYIPEIKSQGDKRLILFNGKLAGALLRVPAASDNRGNLAAGGHYTKYQVNARDLEICAQLESFLIENQIYFAGVDVIGDYLTEINITSPTCLQEINRSNQLIGESQLEFELIQSLTN